MVIHQLQLVPHLPSHLAEFLKVHLCLKINTWYLGIMFSIINARGRCSPHTVSKFDVRWFLSITNWHIAWIHFCNACIYSICTHQHFCKKFQIELLDQQKGSFRFWGQINYLAWTPILAQKRVIATKWNSRQKCINQILTVV